VTARRWLLAALGWAAVIVTFGLVPLQAALDATAGPKHEDQTTAAGHFVEYAVLATLLALALGGWSGRRRSFPLAFAGAALLGLAIEGVQGFLPWRDAQLTDVLVNTLGSACGLAATALVAQIKRSGAGQAAPGRQS
jgi:VanZ family protein